MIKDFKLSGKYKYINYKFNISIDLNEVVIKDMVLETDETVTFTGGNEGEVIRECIDNVIAKCRYEYQTELGAFISNGLGWYKNKNINVA